MKKLILSLFVIAAMGSTSVFAQNATKKEDSKPKTETPAKSCCADKKTADSKACTADKKACCADKKTADTKACCSDKKAPAAKATTADTKSAGKK